MTYEFNENNEKECTTCEQMKHKSCFYPKKTGKNILHDSICMDCIRKRNLAYYHKNKDKRPDRKKEKDDSEFGDFNQYLKMKWW